MFSFWINYFTCLRAFLIVFFLPYTFAFDRTITSQLNPGSQSSDLTNTTLIYVKALGTHDTIHQVWDFTRGMPTVIFVVTSINSSIDITWNGYQPTTFKISEKPKYSFSFIIDKLIEYNDLEDSGQISVKSPQKHFTLHNVKWTRSEISLTAEEVMVKLQASGIKTDEGWKNGSILIKLDLLPFKDYAVELPHLIHTANSTLIDVSLVNMTTSAKYNSSRFAWHGILASTDSVKDEMKCVMRKSLDDEHTPGVFEIIEIKTPESYLNNDGGFLQFRPVGYTQEDRGVTTSTVAHVQAFNRTKLPQHSTAKMFYKNFDKEKLLVEDMFVFFGESGDGFYIKHNYTAWSFTLGYGTPPVEGVSLFVVLVMSIGLGVPVILAFSGVGYVLVRKCRHTNAPRRFSNTD